MQSFSKNLLICPNCPVVLLVVLRWRARACGSALNFLSTSRLCAARASLKPRQPIISLNEIQVLTRSPISSHQHALFPLQSCALSSGLCVHPSGPDEQVDITYVTFNIPSTRLTTGFHDIVPAHSQCKVRQLLLHSLPPDLSPLLFCQRRSALNKHKCCPGSRPQHCLPLPRRLRCSLSNHNRAVHSRQPHTWE